MVSSPGGKFQTLMPNARAFDDLENVLHLINHRLGLLRKLSERESDIVRSIRDYLALRKHHFWRQNTAPAVQKSPDGWRFRRMPVHALKGVPDIILIRPPHGRFVGLEVKRREGRLSPEQKEFARACQAQGGQYHVVHSIEEVQALGL